MALYVSDHTTFIQDWLKSHPEEAQVQKTGRALWWDKPSQDLEEVRQRIEAKVERKAYYYDAN
ncbi:MAG TPA: DUF3460 family protein [Rhodocyclaceae bacterium]|nr:DUF3460 family protein [Rhodocyclaceae bacterium]